ncbi:hypothetical protein [Sedimentitalea arenosa]|jgi:uncharacterized membrane protein YoaK (UPF0700 family)|uniref:Uncharacterized protein n=1 Tax=Sedimentitalea arenosa TaxID=2798803 RepID=A0A8J7IYY5_9RHOB|nr:hypothetical protein [Arenibacterium arenosum]MBJ6369985.1 hypothetical protein [Arenibacterium arenosum]
MDVAGTIAYLPLTAMILGAIAGLLAGRFLTGRWLWALPILLCLAALVLIVRLAAIPEAEAESAFGPFVWLTGGIFPALFTVVMGTLGGRALRGRAQRP